VRSNAGASALAAYTPPSDLTRRHPNPNLGSLRIPRKVYDQIVWLKAEYSKSVSLNTVALTESNEAFQLASLPINSSVASLFDQYCIFSVFAKVQINTSIASGLNPRYLTAIDYDNVGNIGSVSGIQGYNSVVCSEIQTLQQRYLEPCVAPSVYQGTVFNAFANARLWIDTSSSNALHYGFRCIVEPIGAGASGNVTFEFTILIACKNSV